MGLLDGYPFDFYGHSTDQSPLGILGMLAGAPIPMQAPAGGGFPNLAPTDVSAASVQPQMQPQQPQQPQQQGGLAGLLGSLFGGGQAPATPAPQANPGVSPELGMGDRLTAALANFSGAHGLLPAISGALTGGMTGQRTDPLGIMQQQQAATYQALKPALLAKGASPEQAEALARAAMFDPEIKKTIASTIYQAPQLVSGGTDPLTGGITHQVYNPNNQTITNLSPSGQGGGAAQTLTPANAAAIGLPPMSNTELGQIRDLNGSGTQGDDYYNKLKAINPAFADKVKAITDGRIPFPSGPIMRTPYGNMLTDSISALKPGVTAQDYHTQQKARDYWTSGGGAQEIKAYNTAVRHAVSLQEVSDKMGGTNYFPDYLNPVIQGAKVNLGNTDYQDAQKKWDELSETLSTEMSKALNGGKPHVAEQEHWREVFSRASSPQQRQSAIEGAMKILAGRIDEQAPAYQRSMGSAGEPMDFFEGPQKEAFQKLLRGQKAYDTGATQQGQQQKTLAPIDKQALDWANANPQDPRAAKIKQRLGVQ